MINYGLTLNSYGTAAFIAACLAFSSIADAQTQQTYEEPGYYPTNLSVSDSVLRGSMHTVRPRAYCDGLAVTYVIDASDGTTYTAKGTALLYQRIAEIYAIAKLRQMDSGKEFGDSVGNGAKSTVTAVGKTLSDPGKAIEGIPQGVSKFFGSLGEKLKGGQSKYEDKAYSNVLGASKAKRLLAFQLGVNPYSTNKTLQAELNRVGWSEAGGTVLIHMATAAIPAGAGTALNMNRTAEAEVVQNDPSQLNIVNRKKLEGIGVSDDTANLLLKHKWYSPLHRTVITDALVALGPGHGQDVFLHVLSAASSEVDANYFQQVAQLMQQYNNSVSPVGKIMKAGRTVAFYNGRGNWVFPLPLDYCLWTKDVYDRAQRALKDRDPRRNLVLYTTGNFSAFAAAQCAQDGIHVVQTSLNGD